MANQIIFAATITPANTAMEVSINSGTSFAALAFTTVGSNQQGTLTAVPAATYAIGALQLRAVGYSTTMLSNGAAVTVAAAAAAVAQNINWAQGSANSSYTVGTLTVARTSGGGAWDAGRLGTMGIGDIAAATGYLGTYTVPDTPRTSGGVVAGLTASPTTLTDVGYTGLTAGLYWDVSGNYGFFGSGTNLGAGGVGGTTTCGQMQVVVNKDADGIRFDFYLGATLKITRKIAYAASLFPIVPDVSINGVSSQLIGATIAATNLVASGF